MQFHLLADVECLSQLDQNPIQSIEVVAVVATRRSKMHQNQILSFLLPCRLMVLVPLVDEGLFADSTICLDHQRRIFFNVLNQTISYLMSVAEPIFNHQYVFFQTTSTLISVVAEHCLRRTESINHVLDVVGVLLKLKCLLCLHGFLFRK